ncbi:MAG: TonB-dependent receptor [Algiphilus sp.]|uniref:TonB-dependent receptor n=1 Tax=Algiphilus sp. TaxID=1872431 RepID=UPI0032EC0DA8
MRQPVAAVTLGVVLMAGSVAPASVLAQEASPSASPPGQGTRATTDAELGAMVVTARGLRRRQEEVARSVSRLDRALAEEIAAIDFEDLIPYAANLDGKIDPFSGTLRIRGFGTPSTNAGSEPAVGASIDDVFYGRNRFLAANFFDLEETEVLRGPQGTLFGKNTTAGLLRVTTRAPEFHNSAALEVLLGQDEERVIRPTANVALGDQAAIRVAGAFTRRAGRLRNTFLRRNEQDLSQDSMRVRFRFEPTALPWTLDLSAFHSRQAMNNGQFQFTRATDAMRAFAESFDPDFNTDPENFRTSLDFATDAEVVMTGLNARNTIDFAPLLGGGRLFVTSITGAAESRLKQFSLDADFTPAAFLRRVQPATNPYRQFSQELRVSGRFDRLFGQHDALEYTGGIFYLRSTLSVVDRFQIDDLGAAAGYLLAANVDDPPALLPGGAVGGLAAVTAETLGVALALLDPLAAPLLGADQRIDTRLDQAVETIAAYGQSEYRLLPRWFAILGLRVAYESKDGDFLSQGEGRLIGLVGEQEDHQSTVQLSEHGFSPRVGLRWEPMPKVHTFFTWARGTKSGGFNAIPLTPDNLAFEEEKADSFELGSKVALLGGSLRLQSTAFWTDFSNLQVSTFRDNRFFILNAAEARSRGLELDLHWMPPLPGTSLFASLGYSDAQFEAYPNAPAPADAGSATQDLSGRRLPRAPRITAAIKPRFVTPLEGGSLNLILGGDVQYRGKRFLDVDLDPRSLQPATTVVNLRATLSDFVHGWSLTIAGQNLTDEVTLSQILDQPLAPGNFIGVRSDRGRFLTASLQLDF